MVDAITLRFLISVTVYENWDIYLMDVVTTYLYGSLENDIYIWKFHKDIRYLKQINQVPKNYIQSSDKDHYMDINNQNANMV